MKKRSLVLFFIAVSAMAGNYDDEIRREWGEKIKQSSDALQHGDYKRSLRIADRLINEMEEMLGPGDSSAQVFGIVVTHKALANVGLGNQNDALWYWHTALSLFPRLQEADLSMFGEAGRFLKEHPPEPPAGLAETKPVTPQTQNVTAPRLLKRVDPRYPRGANVVLAGLDDAGVAELDGTVDVVRVVRSLGFGLDENAVEAIKQWRFEPGRIGGEPVDVLFNLTVNFKPRP